jgi:hypothetical protein
LGRPAELGAVVIGHSKDADAGIRDGGLRAAKRAGKIVAVDPNPHNPLDWRDVTVIKAEPGQAFASASVAALVPPAIEQRHADLLRVEAFFWRSGVEKSAHHAEASGVLLFRGRAALSLPVRRRFSMFPARRHG